MRLLLRRRKELGSSTDRVIAHIRPDSPTLDQWKRTFCGEGAEVDTTAWEREAMQRTIERLRPTIVFSLLGTTKKRARHAREQGTRAGYQEVDYGLSVLAIDACAQSNARPRYVYLSSVGASPSTRNAYLRARHAVEETLRNSGLGYRIARPSFILGRRDDPRPLETVGASLLDGLLHAAGALGARNLRERYRSTTATRLARALVDLAYDEAASEHIAESAELQRRGMSV